MTTTLAPLFAVLGDETRWSILSELGRQDLSASGLAARLPVTRQAITRHLKVLVGASLIEPMRVGREIRYRALGSRLDDLAVQLVSIGSQWDRRLDALARTAERL